MGYLFLIIALLAGTTKGFCSKSVSNTVKSAKGTFYISLIRMLLCSVIGFFIVMAEGLSALKIDASILIITMVSGLSTALFIVTWFFCVRKGAYLMLDVFTMLGVGVTIVLCRIFFDEPVTLTQCVGFILLMLASLIMCSYSANIKGSFTLGNLFLLIICGIFSGMADFSQKWFVYENTTASAGVFNFYTYVFSAIVLIVFFCLINKRGETENEGKSFSVFLKVCLMALCLFLNSYFKTLAAKTITSAVMYPLTFGASILLSALMASIFFKEKITFKCFTGMVITFIALIIMNM